MVLKIVRTVWPVMLTYVAIGAPCGMIMGQTGMEPWMVFALSSTFVTGSGQFMICNLWLAGVPAASIVASVAAISSRFALYSASIAPHLTSTLFAAAVARQRCRGGFGRGVRRRMQVLGPHEYCRAGKRRGRHCHCAGVRCCIRRKRCPRCPLTSSWFCGCRRGLLSRSFASRRRLPCAGERCRPALPRPWVISRPLPLPRWSPTTW